ncbi:MAG: type II toxin-antitoxin system PemK/MazF family toxin [Synechococcales bacterium]|nr:type II toxin-antitoxin system PemK/MazF family toxin [Synechococcales bacterium]
MVKRFDIYLINLDPVIGKEIQKTRPCLIISPNEMNQYLSTVIIAPMTSKGRNYPSRINCKFQGKSGQIVLDQIRSVDKARLTKRLGKLSSEESQQVLALLAEIFAP